MTRLFDPALPIHIETDSAGNPVRFSVHGHRQRLAQVLQHWQVDVDWWSNAGELRREYWAVTTLEGTLCVIYRDLAAEGEPWFLVKVYD